MGAVTICLPAVRMLADRLGSLPDAADVIEQVHARGAGFDMQRHQMSPEWADAFEGIAGWRREADHIAAAVVLGQGPSTLHDGMLLLPPGTLRSDAIALALVGRPVTRLLAHPVLDDSMTITEAVPSTVVQCRFQISNTRIGVAAALARLRAGERP